MTALEVMARVESIHANAYDETDKKSWLTDLEGKIKLNIIDTREGATLPADGGILNGGMELYAPKEYMDMYVDWVNAQIYLANGEIEKYNNSIERFNIAYSSFCNWYNRTHLPIRKQFIYF